MPQHLEALKLANEIRKQRAQLKQKIKEEPSLVIDLMQEPPEYIHTMKVETLLLAVPRFGRGKVDRIIRAARMSWKTQVGDLTAQRRDELTFVIRRYLK